MSWTRSLLAALAVCVLLLTGSVGCGPSDAREQGQGGVSPVGKVLDDTDGEGRHYREVGKGGAPEVGVEVQPDPGGGAGGAGGWDVRLTVRDFRFSPAGAEAKAMAGRGLAYLYVDGRLVTRLRMPEYRLAPNLVPRGTHQVTVRLYADDGTVWAVDGKPVENTAAITASQEEATATPAGTPKPAATPAATPSPAALSAPGTGFRTGGRASPERAGKAS